MKNRIQPYVSQFSRAFHFNSAFFQMFGLVLLLSTLLFGAFSFYILHRENQSLRESTEASYIGMLETTSTATELTLQNMQLLMEQTIWQEDFTRTLVLSPSEDYSRTLNIIKQLHQLAESNPLIQKAYLYIPTSGMVYSSDLYCQPADQVEDPIFQDPSALTAFEGVRPSEDADALVLRKLDGRLFLCQHLYPDNLETIGVLIFEFQLSALNLSLSQDDSSGDPVYVFDASGTAVFTEEAPPEIQEQALALVSSGGAQGILSGADDFLYFYVRSQDTGWLYLYRENAQDLHYSPSLGRVLTVCLIVLTLGLACSFWIAFRANHPIRSLLKGLANDPPDMLDAKNEIDYLTKAYHYTAEQNQNLHQAIQSITPLVLERLFSDILSGRAPTGEHVDAALDSIGRPFSSQARFLVLTLEAANKVRQEISVLEMNLLILQLRSLLRQSLPQSVCSCLLPREQSSAAVVLVFSPDTEDGAIQQTVLELQKKIEGLAHTTPYRLEAACGNVYSRITDLRYSYLEALKSLHHRRFYGEEGPGGPPSRTPYFEQASHILLLIQQGHPEAAQELAGQMIQEIFREYPTQARQHYDGFLHAVIEITEALHTGNREELMRKHARLQTSLDKCPNPQEQREAVSAFCREALSAIEHKSRKRSHQYVAHVQEYIHANYSDSSLSLDTAAEQAGISPSYLSRLFKEERGVSFVDYLNDFRVEKAKSLLEKTDLKVKDIAYQTGFNSMQNFFRIFKKHTGCSPGEYRQRQHS